MIKNERQYRITKAEVQRFREALERLEQAPPDPDVHPLLRQAELDGLRSQREELEEELRHYEALRSGERPIASIESVQEIPQKLIEARIRAGLTQEDLAGKMGWKPQQLQRYEASDYASASLARVAEVAETLNLSLRNKIPHQAHFLVPSVLRKLKTVGLSSEFVTSRLLPVPPGLERAGSRGANELSLNAARGIERVYGWTPAALYGAEPLDVERLSASVARFKLPGRVNALELGAYVVYAHYLALLVLEATRRLPVKPLSADPLAVRQEIIARFGDLSFPNVLAFVWSCGIPVLGLSDPGRFHGACWRSAGRNVIVLKQQTRSASRWVHDLLHEYFHAATAPDLEEHPVIEEHETSRTRRASPEETAASRFAGDVALNGRAEELANICVARAQGSVERLKRAVERVAADEEVDVGALANYLAFRLSAQGISWWAAATNLQPPLPVSRCTPREMLLDHADLACLNPIDRSLLLRALEPQVVAFSGKRASGKSTVSAEVARKLHWKWASFGDYLRAVAKHEGVSDSTETLQELGAKFAGEPDRFCREVLSHFGWQAGEPLIIEGVRHREIMQSLRQLVAPLETRLVFLSVDEQERLRRLEQREEVSAPRMKALEEHSTEEQVKTLLPAEADLKINTSENPDQVVQRVVEWIHAGAWATTDCRE